jgi:hypothetical protein
VQTIFAADPRHSFRKIKNAADLPMPKAHRLSADTRPLRTIPVSSTQQLYHAMQTAAPGDYLQLQPGTYPLDATLYTGQAGTADNPIILGAALPETVTLSVNTLIGISVQQPYWVFEKLTIQGMCPDHINCEHAFQIVGHATHAVIRHNRLLDFNTQIKANQDVPNGTSPNNGIIEGNVFSNTAPRQTTTPVAAINLDVVSDWVVSGNVIADIAKATDNLTSYAGFMKATGKRGIFSKNLVACEWKHAGGIRVGLSFGGGGTRPDLICRNRDCTYHHEEGVIEENIIMNCPNDVGIYINDSRDSRVEDNILYRTRGIDVRFPGASALLRNNRLDGRILVRDGAKLTGEENNRTSSWRAAFLGRTVTDPLTEMP